MRRTRIAVLLLCSFGAQIAPSAALTIDPVRDPALSGSIVGVGSRGATPAEFKLNVVVTRGRPELDRWLALPEGERGRRRKTREFRASQKGSVFLVLTGFKLDELRSVGLTAQVQLYGPDGKLIYNHPDLARSAWGRPAKGYLALVPEVTFAFDQADRAGIYTYRAKVIDTNRTTVARAEEKIIFLN